MVPELSSLSYKSKQEELGLAILKERKERDDNVAQDCKWNGCVRWKGFIQDRKEITRRIQQNIDT